MIVASTVPSLSVYASIWVPSGIFPNGCVVTVVFAPARVAHIPKQRIPIAIAFNILCQPSETSPELECVLRLGTVRQQDGGVNFQSGNELAKGCLRRNASNSPCSTGALTLRHP